MKRLPIKHTSLMTPEARKEDVKRALEKLGVGEKFDDDAIDDVYLNLAKTIGRWFDEQYAKEASPVANALLSTGKELIAATELFSGQETGLHSHVEIETTLAVKTLLAMAPTVGSMDKAEQLLRAFRENALMIGQACIAAGVDLASEISKGGREKLNYFDDFTELLLDIASKAGVEPKNFKDRVTGLRSGWLYEAAQSPSGKFGFMARGLQQVA